MAKEKMSRSERLEAGQVQVQVIIEVAGKPKEHVESVIKDYIEKLKEDKNYDITEDFIDEAIERDNLFTTYADIKFWAKDIKMLVGFCFDYMPSSVEILEPEEMIINSKVITDMLNDMQARMHHTDILARNLLEEQKSFNHALNILSKNFVMALLTKNGLNLEKLERTTGIKKDIMKGILDKMIEDKKIKEENGIYSKAKEDGTDKG